MQIQTFIQTFFPPLQLLNLALKKLNCFWWPALRVAASHKVKLQQQTLTLVWTAIAPLHAPTVAAHYSRPSCWHSPHISAGKKATAIVMVQTNNPPKKKIKKNHIFNHMLYCCYCHKCEGWGLGKWMHMSQEQTEMIYRSINLPLCECWH